MYQIRFNPYGSQDWSSGLNASDYNFTGQWLDGFDLLDYNARYYDATLGRFISPDSVVPDYANPQNLNRYSYVRGNPVRFNDPSGHALECGGGIDECNSHQYTNPSGSYASPAQVEATIEMAGTVLEIGAIAVTAAVAWEYLGAEETLSTAWNWGKNLLAPACADGDCGNEAKLGLDSFTKAADFGIQTYNKLRTAIKGTGLQAHHIIERRFAPELGLKPEQMPSVALTPEEHQQFTNAWRNAIAYNNSSNPLRTSTATREQIWAAAQDIYARYPKLLEAARETLFGTNP